MNGHYDVNLIAKELAKISPDVDYAVAHDEKTDGSEIFVFFAIRILTTDEMVSICRDMATVIRREIPERSDGWAASILATKYAGPIMGVYNVGWAGRADTWKLKEGQERKATDHADWLALTERLRVALTALGTERHPGDRGDFHMLEEDGGEREQAVFVHRPEFLTPQLIIAIQGALRDAPADWRVEVVPAFPPPFDKLFRGVDVRVNSIREKWNRRQVEKLLGDRLKI